MPASILQTYLRLHLLDLGGDDSRLHKLKAAASELAGGFAEAPATALPVFLATLRPDEGVGDAFANVGGAIERQLDHLPRCLPRRDCDNSIQGGGVASLGGSN